MKTETVKTALESAYANLENNRLLINSLNVFPVPDGDTGDNMCMTFKSGIEKIRQTEYKNTEEMIADFSLACLMGARGNSGVILSLALKGFAMAFSPAQTLTSYMAKGFENSVELCYKSVSSPKEGTALTVLRACCDKAHKMSLSPIGFKKAFSEVFKTAVATLSKTKELLPQLKEANVVDSGAKGFVCLMEGIRLFVEDNKVYTLHSSTSKETLPAAKKSKIEHKFCCECVVRVYEKMSSAELESLGDSVVFAQTDDIAKFHVHSNFPEKVLALAKSKGEIVNVKIENMQFQHNLTWGKKKKFGFIAVATGEGISDCFKQLGCDKVILSSEKISSGEALDAIGEINAENIFIFPNDKNNFLAFNQAVKMSDKSCVIIKTTDPAQAIGVMMNFDETLNTKENEENFVRSLSKVRTGKICVADKSLKNVKKGDSIGIIEDKIEICEKDIFLCMEKVVEKLCDKDYNDISVFFGKSVSKTERKNTEKKLSQRYTKSQVNIIDGGQDIYDYIVMVE